MHAVIQHISQLTAVDGVAYLGCLRRGPTEEADSVLAMKGWLRGLSLTSLHDKHTLTCRYKHDILTTHN